ncbi:hypothetical protein PMI14_05848 [Acidovorax sp. CF316]|uniref:hypothetical protein n=1 Tax=Acidovorax sp. CF316 TaxID=1144317 RepID=UPI00026BC808|nr:hypothetical protein [Acidovorax sp. CF316]EJE49605.1 hypothetical protein PMI14_05848 [Acidovorax sp. CF316]
MQVLRERQLNPVGDEVLAITAVVAPILMGVLSALKQDVVAEVGGHANVKLKMLPRLYRPGDGDVGICFEYAVHEAMNNGDAQVLNRIESAIKLCRIKNTGLKSILFGMEKSGAVQLINTAHDVLTEESRALTGQAGQPPKLRRRLNLLAAAFRKPTTRLGLPYSIRGLWKADLFVGSVTTQQWVGTSIKINPSQLEGAAGLRVGIVPTRQGRSDAVRIDEAKNMVICPLHHDGDFMQVFYEAWRIVQAFLAADAKLPKEALLPRPVDREICRMLEERREYPTIDVVEALKVFGQPELLATDKKNVKLEIVSGEQAQTSTLLAPMSRTI